MLQKLPKNSNANVQKSFSRLLFDIGTRKIKSIYLEAEGISKIFGDGEDISKIMIYCVIA